MLYSPLSPSKTMQSPLISGLKEAESYRPHTHMLRGQRVGKGRGASRIEVYLAAIWNISGIGSLLHAS